MWSDLIGKHPFIIAGPCSAESREQVLRTADAVSTCGVDLFRAGIWKPRTKPGGFEGIGRVGLDWLREVKERTRMMVTTEVATPSHVEAALKVGIDVLWIGARTTVNPFAVQEIADVLKGVDIPVLIKNPINPDIELWCGAVQRFVADGITDIGLVHRGFSSYEEKIFRNTPIWQIPIEMKRRFPEIPIICDPSHIAGRRELVPQLCQQAIDLNFDGLMIETHCDPECALSDARQQIPAAQLNELLRGLIIRNNSDRSDDLAIFRDKIDRIDHTLLELLSERMMISKEIGAFKKLHKIPVLQHRRYDSILQESVQIGKDLNLNPDFVAFLIKAIHEESIKQQID